MTHMLIALSLTWLVLVVLLHVEDAMARIREVEVKSNG